MSMPTEAVEALHALTSELKTEHERRDECLRGFDHPEEIKGGVYDLLQVTRAEAERIFADRIAAHEARLKELGWTRTIRVEPQPQAVSSIPVTDVRDASGRI